MTLRPYRPEDCPALAELFYHTVHTVCVRDYTQSQLDAWADGRVELAAWNASFLEHTTLVAVEGETIVGFADLAADGYLDRLYVHRDWQRRGVASALCDALPGARVTRASLTARPFFERRGWRVVREQQVERHGVLLTNFIMEC
ncbi:GNAT family N-acetyltransferase [Pseudoflavonifractor phocaeensis]|uniref:GNAT family N-acetyltransferase n=1 Tax=Pseudoflavonifractor phocaeensis TaxID=1870988 RepID=UPI00195E63E7|nr:GNAT family N-acetyltransferase [Pseudoflavonifractor phocaeensis]MBM6721640.1 GNAT family N-acetyltransferase [Pseudoflavonifractor phocaeensis]